jgi:hypothetical protein
MKSLADLIRACRWGGSLNFCFWLLHARFLLLEPGLQPVIHLVPEQRPNSEIFDTFLEMNLSLVHDFAISVTIVLKRESFFELSIEADPEIM